MIPDTLVVAKVFDTAIPASYARQAKWTSMPTRWLVRFEDDCRHRRVYADSKGKMFARWRGKRFVHDRSSYIAKGDVFSLDGDA